MKGCGVFIASACRALLRRAEFRFKGFGFGVLGGSWVVISGVTSAPNMGYNYSYPTFNRTVNYH